jgi:hypothetical protein
VSVRRQLGLGYDGDLRAWTAPFVMAALNTAVVARSVSQSVSQSVRRHGTVPSVLSRGVVITVISGIISSGIITVRLWPP